MKKLFQKAQKAIKEGGMWLLIKRFTRFLIARITMIVAVILRPFIIAKIKKFNANSSEEAFDFSQSSYLGSFIAPAQVKSEFVGLLNIFKEKEPKVVVEIGTANGGTLFCFSKLAPDGATIASIDLPGGEFGGGYPKGKAPLYGSFKKDSQKMFLLREDSHSEQTVEKLKKVLNGKKIDFLFIDGDHTYEGVKKDFELYSPLVGAGGIVAFHDIAVHPDGVGCFVNLFWDEIKGKYKYKEFIEDKNQGWGGIGVLFV
jgi:cephalosporin hydroxylase